MKSQSIVLLFLIVAVVIIVEGSVFVRTSLLRPRRGIMDDCFSCRTEDRPVYYPLIKYFNKVKDVFVKGFNAIAETAKEYKLLPQS